MESSAKRIKLEIDPLVLLCDDVHDLIFQHFNAKDVLRGLEISKTWNCGLAQSPTAMKNVQLKVSGNIAQRSARNIILKSERKYQNLGILYPTKANWIQKLRVLEIFSPSIVDLYVLYNILPTAKHQNINFSFPNLKSMTIKESTSSKFVGNLINAAPILEKISITFADFARSLNTVDAIAKKSSLKELSIEDNPSNNVFFHNVAFKLTSFKIEDNFKITPQIMLTFLMQSSKTLTTLKLSEIAGTLAISILTDFPVLKSLEFDFICDDFEEIKNPTLENFSITSVKIDTLDPIEKQLLICMKGLQTVSFDEGDMEWVMKNRSNWVGLENINGQKV